MAPPSQQSGSKDVKKVMISSTARDWPERRDLVKDASLRKGRYPVMMEHMPFDESKYEPMAEVEIEP